MQASAGFRECDLSANGCAGCCDRFPAHDEIARQVGIEVVPTLAVPKLIACPMRTVMWVPAGMVWAKLVRISAAATVLDFRTFASVRFFSEETAG